MEFDDTRSGETSLSSETPRQNLGRHDLPESELHTRGDDELGDEFDSARESSDGHGLGTRHNKAMIAAALFDEPAVPVKIGRFTVVRELGAGGMGVVYVAYDEQLDRRVAVKLLRGADPSSDASRRLAREAQAMARLTHANVLTVHDVGEFEGQVFVAMEFVDGSDLRRWLAAEPRDWRAIVEVFIEAGRGLAAAHDAGLVHRDFKPDNVLIGKDGRVKVADFGLAHAFDAPREQLESSGDSNSSSSNRQLEVALTRTGAIMGTPAYMAPEQYAGRRTDARSDQFSFCVALWEGLHKQRPFTGKNLAALSLSIAQGRIQAPPESNDVPAWITAVLTRGLSSRPEQRWPSMVDLLDALARDPVARRRRSLLAFGLGGAALTLLTGLSWLSVTELRTSARARYWTGLTEQLLEIERERGLRQANDDAQRARDATRMSVYRRVEAQDPTTAAVLLREVEGVASSSTEWISAANQTLGSTISYVVLSGHRDSVDALAFTPDGRRLVSGSFDGEVRSWDIHAGTGQLLYAHTKHVTKLAVSADGEWLASSSQDGTVRLRSLVAEGEAEVIARYEHAATDVAFDARQRVLASASKDHTAQLYDLVDGSMITLRGHDDAVYGVSFDAAGERVLTVSHDKTAKLWRVSDGRLLASFGGHSQGVFHGRILADGRILTASDDGSLRVHASGGEASEGQVLARHAAAVTSLDVHDDAVVSAAVDGSMIVSSLSSRHAPIELPAHAASTWTVAFTPDGEFVASASFDQTARLTRADGRGVPLSFVGHRNSLLRLVIDPTGSWMATGSYDTDARVWSLARQRLATPLVGHTDTVFSVESDAAGNRIVSSSHDGSVRIWDARDGTAIARTNSTSSSYVNHARFDPRGELVGIGRGDGHVELWHPASGVLRELEPHARSAWRLAFDSTGARMVSASFDETARVWDTQTGALLLTLRGHKDKLMGVDFAPTDDRIVTASQDGSVRIWDAGTGEPLASLIGHTGKISSLLRSPDGQTLATTSDDGSVRLWPDAESEHAIVLRGHTKHVWSVAFDASGERLITGSYDGRAMVWNAADGALLRSLDGHGAEVNDAAFASDGRAITVSKDGRVRVWDLDSDAPPVVLSSQSGGLTSLALTPDNHAISASDDGSIMLWEIAAITTDTGLLRQELRSATIHCLSVDERVLELGENQHEAALARESCVLARGR